jgi:hypothetical protein
LVQPGRIASLTCCASGVQHANAEICSSHTHCVRGDNLFGAPLVLLAVADDLAQATHADDHCVKVYTYGSFIVTVVSRLDNTERCACVALAAPCISHRGCLLRTSHSMHYRRSCAVQSLSGTMVSGSRLRPACRCQGLHYMRGQDSGLKNVLANRTTHAHSLAAHMCTCERPMLVYNGRLRRLSTFCKTIPK